MSNSDSRGDFSANRRLIFLSGVSLIIGAACSLVAIVLLKMIALFTNIFYSHQFTFESRMPSLDTWGVGAILVPVVGGLIIGLMARYGTEKIRGHGIPEALEAILFGKSLMSPKVAILKPISSAISIGSGGPFGAEGPIIMTGGAFGSLLAQTFNLTSSERKTLLVAGAAAGMTAVFASPISAVLLSVELLLFEWRPRSLVPVAVACAVAAAIRPHLMGSGPLFPVPAHPSIQSLDLVIAAGVGISAGLFSALISNLLYKLEDQFAKLPIHWMWWPALGGVVVGIGGYFEPRALGVGYSLIEGLLRGDFSPHSVLGLVVIKALIWIFALASGTSGGVLAPLLIMGAGLGVLESAWIPGAHSTLWALVSMAGVLGGMMRSPFTAILFALELTHDTDSLLPIMIGSIAAYAITVLVMKRSILTEKVARRGYDIFREYSVDPLERMRISEIMTPNPITIPFDLSVRELAGQFLTPFKKHRGFPVVKKGGELVGLLTSVEILESELKTKEEKLVASDLIRDQHLVVAYPHESCRVAAERMASHGVGRLPVIENSKSKKVLGIVTRSDLLKPIHRDFEEEQKQESFFWS